MSNINNLPARLYNFQDDLSKVDQVSIAVDTNEANLPRIVSRLPNLVSLELTNSFLKVLSLYVMKGTLLAHFILSTVLELVSAPRCLDTTKILLFNVPCRASVILGPPRDSSAFYG